MVKSTFSTRNSDRLLGERISQTELLKRFKQELSVGNVEQWQFGSIQPFLMVDIFHQLGFGTELVAPEESAEKLKQRYLTNCNSIIFCQCGPGSIHSFRVGSMLSTESLWVMDPNFFQTDASEKELSFSQIFEWKTMHLFVSKK